MNQNRKSIFAALTLKQKELRLRLIHALLVRNNMGQYSVQKVAKVLCNNCFEIENCCLCFFTWFAQLAMDGSFESQKSQKFFTSYQMQSSKVF